MIDWENKCWREKQKMSFLNSEKFRKFENYYIENLIPTFSVNLLIFIST